jgi:hypothetical protein
LQQSSSSSLSMQASSRRLRQLMNQTHFLTTPCLKLWLPRKQLRSCICLVQPAVVDQWMTYLSS